jgi:hypothetical protein
MIEKSFPDIRLSFPNIGKSFPKIRISVPKTGKSSIATENLPDNMEVSPPNHEK